jgi:predicted transport protein
MGLSAVGADRGEPKARVARYSRTSHLVRKPVGIAPLLEMIEGRIREIGDVREVFTKTYIAFEGPKGGFASVIVQRSKLAVYLRVPFGAAPRPDGARMRDVSGIGHHGYGDTEYSVHTDLDVDGAVEVARAAYNLRLAR